MANASVLRPLLSSSVRLIALLAGIFAIGYHAKRCSSARASAGALRRASR